MSRGQIDDLRQGSAISGCSKRTAAVAADEPNPRLWAPWTEHEQGRGGVGVWQTKAAYKWLKAAPNGGVYVSGANLAAN
jgi:hypothetical protein